MNKNNHKTRQSLPVLSLYMDALFGAFFTYIIDLTRIQSGDPTLSVSEALALWLLLGGFVHLFGLLGEALLNRFLLWLFGAAPMPESAIEIPPTPVIFAVPDDEADSDSFWRRVEEEANQASFWGTSPEDDDV